MASYYVLKNIFTPEQCALLAEYAYFKAKLRPNIKKNIDPLDHVHREYGDLLFESLFEKLLPEMERTLGLELWPTLSFYYLYTQNNTLQKHKDRSSCQWVASLCIGADPEFKKTWPLYLQNQNKQEDIHLKYGDILLFKGHETEHWRPAFPGQWFVSAIFGFVEKNGPYAFQKYDQRKALGRPHVGMFRWTWGCLKNQILRFV